MKIKIIGGGWYGCHIALQLKRRGHVVVLYERGPNLFCGASGANQSRLHLGFHYPRNAQTRVEAVENYREFMADYPQFTRPVLTNIYAVAQGVSLIDFQTYHQIMAATGLEMLSVDPLDYGLTNLEGAVLTKERLILAKTARAFFEQELAEEIQCGVETTPEMSSGFDAVIDCSFGSFRLPAIDWFEPCLLLIYKAHRTDFALTVMDGPQGCSVYPFYLDGYVSLTTVSETPLIKASSMMDARSYIDGLREADIAEIADKMECRVAQYYPKFDEWYRRTGHVASVRVKPKSDSDRRVNVVIDGEFLTIFPGKIGGIFDAMRSVDAWLA